MDFGRFISLLVNESIYFPCAMDFHDPFEGHLPISHAKAMKSITENVFGSLIQNMGIKAKGMTLPDYGSLHSYATDEVKKKTGISCWHMNDYESEAMWKLYADRELRLNQLSDNFKVHCRVRSMETVSTFIMFAMKTST